MKSRRRLLTVSPVLFRYARAVQRKQSIRFYQRDIKTQINQALSRTVFVAVISMCATGSALLL